MFSRDRLFSMTHPELNNIPNISIFHINYNIPNSACQDFEKIFFYIFSCSVLLCPACVNKGFYQGNNSKQEIR